MTTGRPTFQLDAKRLKSVREEASLTQLEVARQAYERLDKPDTQPELAKRHYQKIERYGKTSKRMAEALAKVLGTTVAVLQGEAPDNAPALIDQLEQQLREQRAAGTNTALLAELAQMPDASNPERELAIRIVEQLEYAQLGQQHGTLGRLSELTGWSEAQLMQPVSLHGHWLLLSTDRGFRASTTVADLMDTLGQIQQTGTEVTGCHESDATITLREELPWLQVDVWHPCRPDRRSTFRFVRCVPKPTGLHWVNPTWRDRFWIDEALLPWAHASANFVQGFNGQRVPRDVRALRMLIEKISPEQPAQKVAVIKGDLDELPDDMLDRFKNEGNSHVMVTNRIAMGLWDALAPLLDEWPADRWQVRSDASVVIELARSSERTVQYRLGLVEEVEANRWRPVPWRASDVKQIADKVRQHLREAADRARAAPRTKPPQG